MSIAMFLSPDATPINPLFSIHDSGGTMWHYDKEMQLVNPLSPRHAYMRQQTNHQSILELFGVQVVVMCSILFLYSLIIGTMNLASIIFNICIIYILFCN